MVIARAGVCVCSAVWRVSVKYPSLAQKFLTLWLVTSKHTGRVLNWWFHYSS